MARATPIALVLGILSACTGAAHPDEGTGAGVARAGVCDPQHPEDAMSRLLDAPIVPPQLFGGVDEAGDLWAGLSLADMERAYCQSDPMFEDEESATVGWGNPPSYPVTVEYLKSNHQIRMFTLYPGYKGTLAFASRPAALRDPSKPNPFGQHQYSIGVGRPILRDGQPWLLDWTKGSMAQATEIFDALMYTFAPALPSTQDSCTKQQSCIARTLPEGEGIFGARPLGIYFDVANVDAPPLGASTPDYIYGYAIKMTPFSEADTLLKLDDEGPQAIAQNIGDHHASCLMKLGMSFASFLTDCVEVLSDPKANELQKAKVLGGTTRKVDSTATPALTGTWNLDVTGVHPDFASERFDEQEPPATAQATGLILDDRSTGKVLNDYSDDGTTQTLAGTAAIYREYARLVQAFLHDQMAPNLPRFSLGDPRCLLPDDTDAATWHPATGCTGMEQFVTPADPSTSTDPGVQRLSVGPTEAPFLGITTALRPGLLGAAFCADPGTFDHCTAEAGVFSARDQAIAVLGGGDESTLPAAARDRKVYVRLWAKALIKYLRAATQHPTDLADPRFDSLTPQDGDITVESVQDDLVSVKYLGKLEYRVHYLSSQVDEMRFH